MEVLTEVDLNITGFRITEENEIDHTLYLFTRNSMYADMLDNELGNDVQIEYFEGGSNEHAIVKIVLLDLKQTTTLRIDKRFAHQQYLDWLRETKVTHLGIYYFEDGKDILRGRIRTLSFLIKHNLYV